MSETKETKTDSCDTCQGPTKAVSLYSKKKAKYYGMLVCLGKCKDNEKYPHRFFGSGADAKPASIDVLINIHATIQAIHDLLAPKMEQKGAPDDEKF